MMVKEFKYRNTYFDSDKVVSIEKTPPLTKTSTNEIYWSIIVTLDNGQYMYLDYETGKQRDEMFDLMKKHIPPMFIDLTNTEQKVLTKDSIQRRNVAKFLKTCLNMLESNHYQKAVWDNFYGFANQFIMDATYNAPVTYTFEIGDNEHGGYHALIKNFRKLPEHFLSIPEAYYFGLKELIRFTEEGQFDVYEDNVDVGGITEE